MSKAFGGVSFVGGAGGDLGGVEAGGSVEGAGRDLVREPAGPSTGVEAHEGAGAALERDTGAGAGEQTTALAAAPACGSRAL
jgi:hypothetical protein